MTSGLTPLPTTAQKALRTHYALVLATNTPNSASTLSAGFLKTVVLRVPALYGPRDLQVSGALIARANTIATPVQFGHGKAKHEWLYLESAALAHILAAKALP
jgi:sterol-4alpha-carboxylate 3-dehydrogenase (decarboxylating)